MHGAADVANFEGAGAEPFEVARFLPVERRRNAAPSALSRREARRDRRYCVTNSSSGTGFCSSWYTFRRWRRNRSSNSRSWSDEWSSPYHQNQSLPSAISTSSRAPRKPPRSSAASLRRLLERLTRVGQLAPGAPIVGVADPDVEVRVDPGAGKDPRQLGGVAPAHPSDMVTVRRSPGAPRGGDRGPAERDGRRLRNAPMRSRRPG